MCLKNCLAKEHEFNGIRLWSDLYPQVSSKTIEQSAINEAKKLGLTPAKANSLIERSGKEKVREPS